MGIFSRTRDIIAANFNDLLDQADDPAKMIRMIILEMEETLVEVRASAARTIADQKEMRRQILKLERLQESWTEKAELALSKHTLYKWSRKGPPFFPVCVRLPNQQIRVARRALEDWLRERSS